MNRDPRRFSRPSTSFNNRTLYDNFLPQTYGKNIQEFDYSHNQMNREVGGHSYHSDFPRASERVNRGMNYQLDNEHYRSSTENYTLPRTGDPSYSCNERDKGRMMPYGSQESQGKSNKMLQERRQHSTFNNRSQIGHGGRNRSNYLDEEAYFQNQKSSMTDPRSVPGYEEGIKDTFCDKTPCQIQQEEVLYSQGEPQMMEDLVNHPDDSTWEKDGGYWKITPKMKSSLFHNSPEERTAYSTKRRDSFEEWPNKNYLRKSQTFVDLNRMNNVELSRGRSSQKRKYITEEEQMADQNLREYSESERDNPHFSNKWEETTNYRFPHQQERLQSGISYEHESDRELPVPSQSRNFPSHQWSEWESSKSHRILNSEVMINDYISKNSEPFQTEIQWRKESVRMRLGPKVNSNPPMEGPSCFNNRELTFCENPELVLDSGRYGSSGMELICTSEEQKYYHDNTGEVYSQRYERPTEDTFSTTEEFRQSGASHDGSYGKSGPPGTKRVIARQTRDPQIQRNNLFGGNVSNKNLDTNHYNSDFHPSPNDNSVMTNILQYESIPIGLAPKRFPHSILSGHQMDLVLKEIMTFVIKQLNEEVKPQFYNLEDKCGVLVIQCANQTTVDWLSGIVNKIKPWKGAQLKSIQSPFLFRSFRFVGTFFDYESASSTFLNDLNKENRNLNIDEWRIISKVKLNDNRVSIMFSVDYRSLLKIFEISGDLGADNFALKFKSRQVTLTPKGILPSKEHLLQEQFSRFPVQPNSNKNLQLQRTRMSSSFQQEVHPGGQPKPN